MNLASEPSSKSGTKNLEYAETWVDWWSDWIDGDTGAMYIGIDLWSLAPWAQQVLTLRRLLKKTCVLTTGQMFPELNLNSGNRFPTHLALAVFGVPARKPEGVYHSHLFLRVPPAALGSHWTTLAIKDAGKRTVVQAPHGGTLFVKNFRRLSSGAVSSVHVVHDRACSGEVANLAADVKRRQQRLNYLLQTGAEVRHWNDAIMEPFSTWLREVKRRAAASWRSSP